jgi:hypothetical protein
MSLPRTIAISFIVVLAAIAIVAWLFVRPANALPQAYRNNAYGFSLRLPPDYTVTEAPNANAPEENGVADIIEFSHASGGVQLTITYASYASPQLSVQSVLPNYPYINSSQTQPFSIAPGVSGLALNDDPGHPDQITDVWFGQSGYLYQLTGFGDGRSALLPIAHSLTLF